ncbi:MAG TPA: helix-turn-helix domain-containing protein [Pseudomonadales bacterium]|nr:helix-turn-helix domain-containing protein [Pseudomonadales bacterium]
MISAVRTAPRTERRTQAQRRAESEHRILQAAAELFGEQGYVDTTMEQIGARAGFSAALIARKFGSKPGVIEALLHAIRRNTGAAIDPDGDRDIVDVVRRYVRLIAAGNVWSRALYVLMAESVGPLRHKAELFAKHNRSFISTLAAGIARAQRDGRANADVKPRAVATELVARIRGITLLWLIDPTVDFGGMTSRLIDELRNTLAVDAPPARRKAERATATMR